MLKGLIIVLCFALYVLVTLFGLGPVLLADGSMNERMLTLAVVILLYIGITAILAIAWRKGRGGK